MNGYKFNLKDQEVQQFKTVVNNFRSAERLAIGALPINTADITPDCVIYRGSYKTIKGDIFKLDWFMKSIISVERTDYGYTGYSVDKHCNVKKFTVDLSCDSKLYNLGGLTVGIKLDYDNRNKLKINITDRRIAVSSLIACLELLLSGYYLADWNTVGVNHKDNSAGKESARIENINPPNLELYRIDRAFVTNTQHYDVWKNIKDYCNIHSSFSCYNIDFKYFVNRLINGNKLNETNLMSWRNKRVDKDTGIVYFD